MSIEAVSWALKQELPPSEKLVLISLADHHNRGTGLCIPGQASIGEQTCMSVRTVQRHLKSLEERGLILRRARFRPEGRGRTSDSYVLQGDNLTPMPADQRDIGGATNTTKQNDQHDTVVVAITGREPEENRKVARRTSMTADWQPDPENIERLKAKHPTVNVEREVDAFRDHFISKGEPRADWNAGLRTWIRNAEKWDKPKGHLPTGQFPAGSGGVYL